MTKEEQLKELKIALLQGFIKNNIEKSSFLSAHVGYQFLDFGHNFKKKHSWFALVTVEHNNIYGFSVDINTEDIILTTEEAGRFAVELQENLTNVLS